MASDLLLTINGGSSSIKVALFSTAAQRIQTGEAQRIGQGDSVLVMHDADGHETTRIPLPAAQPADALAQHLHTHFAYRITAIAHRVVHGGLTLNDHTRITPEVLAALRAATPLDRAHLPAELALIDAFQKHFPAIPQIACLDTAFHRDLPTVATLLPIPRRYLDRGIRRLGFHGLSYTYLLNELRRQAGDAANGRVILAHLGSGASMAALRDGKPIDTSMAFTPTAGLVMGTRPGDLDPGLLLYLLREESMSPDRADQFINRECGLAGVSATSSDMRDLLARRATDPRAADAVALFCYQARKTIGAYAAALNGLDTLVFSGGIGEHAWQVREEICTGLDFLGLHLDPQTNRSNAPVISPSNSPTTVRVIPTDEEAVMAEIAFQLIDATAPQE